MAREAHVVALLVLCTLSGAAALSSKERPVTKVINLMKDMIAQMGKEAEEDQEVYDQMKCWCDSNTKEKTIAINTGEARAKSLGTSISGLTASSAKLGNEIKKLNKELAKNEETLDSAKALRTKQLAEFNAEEKDALASIGSLKGAVVSLSKANEGAAFLQTGASTREYTSYEALARSLYHKHTDVLAESLTQLQREVLLQTRSTEQRSGAPSGEIFGILQSMKESFETNLATSQQEETTNQKAYEDLKAAKTEEVAAATAQVESKSQEKALADEKAATDSQDKEDTEETLEVDKKFLADVTAKCASMDAEFLERVKSRQEEVEAVQKAMSFLTSDEAHALFAKTVSFEQSFVQVSRRSKMRTKMAKSLEAAANRVRDPQLSMLAMKVRKDSFDAVKKNIADMVTKLEKEGEEEVAQKAQCVDMFNKNSAATEEGTRTKDKLSAKVDDYTMTVKDLDAAIATLKTEIADSKKQMKRAGEDRELENRDFQLTVADQRATQKLLGATLNVLKGFYEKASFVQRSQETEGQPAFKKHEKNSQSGGLLGMIQSIIDDSKALAAEAMQAEDDAQTAYESFVKNTNDSVDEKTKDLVNKMEVRSQADVDRSETKVQLEEAVVNLDTLAKELHDIHINCDWLQKNFALRQEKRDDEIDALQKAITMFGGAAFSSFLQSPRMLD